MSTLSFTCPKCQRPHDRVKPEMAGYKVKCQCGHVFRLGAKTNRIPGVDKEHAHRKKMAHNEAVPRHLPGGQVSIPAGNRDPNPSQLKRPAAISDNLPVAEFLDDAVPLDPIDMLIPDELFGADGMFLAEPVLPSGRPLKEPFPVLPLEAFPLQSTVPQRPGSIQTTTAAGKNSATNRRLSSPLGPVVTLVCSVACLLLAGYFLLESIMLMVALWAASQFGIEPLPEQSLLKLLVSVYTGMNVVLVGTTMTLAIVAIIELVQSRRIIWACRFATIFSGLMLGFLFLCSVLLLLTASSIPGSSDFDAGQRAAGISVTIVMFILFRCFAPTVIGIVGIIRMFAKI